MEEPFCGCDGTTECSGTRPVLLDPDSQRGFPSILALANRFLSLCEQYNEGYCFLPTLPITDVNG